jgi:hypothetical protein
MTIRTWIVRFAVAGGMIAGAAIVPVSAFATCNNYAGGSCGSAGSAPTPATAVSSQTSKNAGLPFTGGDVFGVALIGVGAIAGGTALVRSGRRKAVGA